MADACIGESRIGYCGATAMPPTNVEVVRWITDEHSKPDTDRTVLINVISEDVELVIDGFWSEGCWHNGEGWELRQAKVVAWAEKPKGLRRAGGAL